MFWPIVSAPVGTMTHAFRWVVLGAVILLGLSATGDGAEARRCGLARACGELAAGRGEAYIEVQMVPDSRRRGRRARQLRGVFPQDFGDDQEFGEDDVSSGERRQSDP